FAELGLRNVIVRAVLLIGYLLALLGAAWLGYGPGLLTGLLTIVALPRLLGSSRSLGNNAVRYLLATVILLLISRLGQTSRRRLAEARLAADQLEIRVQQRTEEVRQRTEEAL